MPELPRYGQARYGQARYPTQAEILAALIFPPPKTKKGPMTDYIPQSYKNLRDWLTRQQRELTALLANTVGMSVDERSAYLASVSILLAKVTEIVDLMEQLEEKTADFEPLLEAQAALIRAAVKRAKTSAGCSPGIIAQLGWAGDSTTFDPQTARPSIEAEAQRGRVKITGKKPGFEACNLYGRKKGDVQWKLIAVRKRKFPYYDEAPLTVANTPEVREYMAIGVIADEEIGQTSEIREVVYAG